MGSAADAVEAERGSTVIDSMDKSNFQHPGKSEAERALYLHLEHVNFTWTEKEEKRLLLKLDLMIIPLAMISGLLTFADSGAYGVAAVFGMVQDLGLYDIKSSSPLVISTIKYSWSSSIPTFGNIITIFPIMLLAQRAPLGKLYGSLVLWTGVFALLMLAVHDFTGTMIVRFFYGAQSAISSVLIIYVSFWYTQKEQSARLGLIACGAAGGSLVGQGIDFGAVTIGGRYADQPWRWMYVIIGSISLGFAIFDMIILPNSPTTARFLSEREKMIAIERVRRNGTGMQSSKFKIKSAVFALKDPQLWGLAYVTFVVAFGNSALGSFGGLLASSFGYGEVETLKLLMPSSGIAIVVLLVAGFIPTYVNNARIYVAIVSFLITIAGNLLLWRSPRDNKGALLGGLYISVFFFGAYVHLQSLIASNIGGNTKKTAATTIIFMLSSIGGFVAPFTYKGEESTEGYPTGIITTIVLQVIAVFVLIALRFHYARYNKKADADMAARGITALVEQDNLSPDAGFTDVNERDVPYFRYQY